ncbi:putative methyltransferase-like protein [Toxoplasma gondii TgCatPRC2]|uniref:Putative methyltransferase-like protein n=1 Tax=Toxoplasma gondii TgCatPRC2 TaxID=1130821 RepID=A0A151H778_TOXGO|nr:putative methyltransferase-like protein [Toxoplasma gondii TgCatPRC2]
MEQMQRPENLSLFRRYVNDRRTWSFRVKAFGKSLSVEEQREKMNFFAPLFSGKEKVSLEHPDVTLALAEVRQPISGQQGLGQQPSQLLSSHCAFFLNIQNTD